MSSMQKQEFERYPKYKRAYIKAFEKMLKHRGKSSDWTTGEDVYNWWVNK